MCARHVSRCAPSSWSLGSTHLKVCKLLSAQVHGRTGAQARHSYTLHRRTGLPFVPFWEVYSIQFVFWFHTHLSAQTLEIAGLQSHRHTGAQTTRSYPLHRRAYTNFFTTFGGGKLFGEYVCWNLRHGIASWKLDNGSR